MPSELLFLSSQFCKLAGVQDLDGQFDWLENKLKLEDSWDGVTELSTPRIFYQELKLKEEHKNKIRATKIIFELRKYLSAWRALAVKSLKEDKFLHCPSLQYKTIYNIIKNHIDELRPLIKDFGGSKDFQDEHLQKFFRALKIMTKFIDDWENDRNFPLSLYAELIYLNQNSILEILKQKLEKRIKILSSRIESFNQQLIDFVKYFALDLLSMIYKENLTDLSDSEKNEFINKIVDVLKEEMEDCDDYEIVVRNCLQRWSQVSNLPMKNLKYTDNWEFVVGMLEQIYDNPAHEQRINLKFVLKEVLNTKSISQQMFMKLVNNY